MFLDETIVKGSMVEHLPAEELPPLADYDDANYLARQGFPVCASIKRVWLNNVLKVDFHNSISMFSVVPNAGTCSSI